MTSRAWPPDLRTVATILLFAWCGLGLLHTAYVMVRPHGLILRRPPEIARTLGLPGTRDSRTVVGILELLDEARDLPAGPVLAVLPVEEGEPYPGAFRGYVFLQTNHLAYPRPIDVVHEGDAPPKEAAGYVAVITAPGAAPAAGRPAVTRAGFTLHRTPAQ